MPDRHATMGVAKRVAATHWKLMSDGQTARRVSNVPLSLNAIAKGLILDAVASRLLRIDGLTGVVVNIGGDVRVAGSGRRLVSVADPRADSIGGSVLARLHVSNGAVATSGSSERFYTIGREKFSHIIDPRSGQPTSHAVSATILAGSAEEADVLATICSVLPPNESIALIDSLQNVEGVLVTEDGKILASADWPQEEARPATSNTVGNRPKVAKSPPHRLLVEFEINKPENSRRYRRPYVAVWLEDADGIPVKTLSLFLMTQNPGPRWHRDLRRWYSSDQLRRLADDQDLIGTISKPTRNPGKYKVAWDGLDDSGKALTDGEYTLSIEAAREHGTYQLIKHKFRLGGQAFSKQLKGNVEISSASVRYSKSE